MDTPVPTPATAPANRAADSTGTGIGIGIRTRVRPGAGSARPFKIVLLTDVTLRNRAGPAAPPKVHYRWPAPVRTTRRWVARVIAT
ncbi:hypothetical protein GCM10017750_02370 [Streptomyces racemochromogenes]